MSQPAADFTDWIGRREEAHDVATLSSVAGMIATLEPRRRSPQNRRCGAALVALDVFAPMARASEIGADGHPRRGGFMPPVPLPRRMFAGGRSTSTPPSASATRSAARAKSPM